MFSTLTMFVGVVFAGPRVSTEFIQLAPVPPNKQVPMRAPGQKRAVVLIHGLMLQPFSKSNVEKPIPHKWQRPTMPIVQELAKHADVYRFCYSQNVPIQEVVPKSDLAKNVMWLKQLGYKEIVLVAHSAGGLIARQLVEDNPKLGVNKVIQVCAPNAGSTLALLRPVRSNQKPFIISLTKEERKKYLAKRKNVKIPKGIEFVVIVANGVGEGDGILTMESVWTENMQTQGIPCYPIKVTHRQAVRGKHGANLVVRLMNERQPRWTPAKVERAKRQLFGEPEDKQGRKGGRDEP